MSAKFDPADRKALLKQALAAVDEMQAKLAASERSRNEPIAIVGLACRYPGAESPEDLWRTLRSGTDAVSDVPADRWDADAYYDPDPTAAGKMITRRGGFLPRVDLFDPQFFGISPREASSMDPQQRLLLEATWEALEHAGQAPDALVGSQTGVFIGITTSDYSHLVGVGRADQCDVYAATGNALNAAAGRLAFVLGLQGPCVAVDTACSSSLVAIHLACQSLRTGDSTMAIAGGVNIVLRPEAAILFSKWGMLAPDGRCKAFDAAADGFVRGEGCGIIVLKRLRDAVAHGDRVLAIIRGSATNQDGRSSGLTVPSGPAQQAVVRRALATAGIDPAAVDYVETHGTGTPIGDPIEVEALAAEFARRPAGKPLLIGSIKTNIGHTEAASGVAGVIKVVLALQHQEIPPHLHLQQLNPRIAWDRMPLAVPTALTPWPAGDRPRIAGVSSFGFSGTNAHVVIEEAPVVTRTADGDRPRHLLTLSARSRPALAQLAGRMANHLAAYTDESLADVCFTAATGRAQFHHRIALPVSSRAETVISLQGFAEGREGIRLSGDARRASAAKVAFLFTGQGSQYAGMARGLYETHPTFRTAIDRCEELLRPHTDRPLKSVLFPEPDAADGSIDATAWTQPALFAVEYALASVWREWGIEPAVVMGHSLGEYVAAAVAGVFTLEEALTLVAARGRLMQALQPGGAMAAVFAPEARVADALRSYQRLAAIAAVNAPEEIVISGDGDAVRTLCASFGEEGIKTKPLTVSHAFHSPLMDPMLDEFERIAGTIKPRAPRIPLVSNVTGRYVTADEPLDAAYWRRHVRQPVRFLDSVRAVNAKGIEIFLELGPAPVLGGMTRQILESGGLRVFASLRKGRDDWQTMLDALGGLYVEGVPIDWRGFDKPDARRRVALPTYPFQRERHWIDTRQERAGDEAPRAESALPGVGVRSASSGDVVFQAEVSASSEPFLADHAVYDNVIFPAAGYLSLALAAAAQLDAGQASEVVGLSLHEALLFGEGEHRLVQTILSPAGDGAYRFDVYSATASDQPLGPWTRHASGDVRGLAGSADLSRPTHGAPALEDVAGRCSRSLDPAAFYARLEENGIQYGPSYRRVRDLSVGPGEAIGRIATDGVRGSMPVHPAVLDAVFQILGAAWAEQFSISQPDDTFLPLGIRRFWASGSLSRTGDLHSIARISEPQTGHRETIAGDVWCFDASGELVLAVEGFSAKRATRAALLRSRPGRTDDSLYEVAWRPATATGGSPDPLGHWLVFADRSGTGARLAAVIERAGVPCTMVRAGFAFSEDAGGFTIDPGDRGDYVRLLAAISARTGRAPAGVAHLWNLDLATEGDGLPDGLLDCGVGSLLHLVQASIEAGRSQPGRLLIVTRGAQPVGGALAPVNPMQAPSWGFARTIAAEHPELACQIIDLESDTDDAGEADQLLSEIVGAAPYESQIAYRNGARVSPRLVRSNASSDGAVVVPETPYELVIAARGVLDDLVLAPSTAQPPAAGEVQIRLSASALNFRDVLNALGMYPGDPGPLGSESAGEVVAVGAGVEDLQVGDRVVAIAHRAFSTYVCPRAEMVQRIPDGVTDEEAVTVPNAYLTAHYGLVRVGQMQAGDRVLIHAAAGGVGLAAVRLALRAGADVFATAGSPRKRAFLESIGVPHVMDSRSGAFAQHILDATHGAGVDIVLNSLTGDLIDKSMAALAERGRFVEIGKTDLRDADVIRRQRPGVSYTVLDLGVECRNDPSTARSIFAELLSAVQSGDLPALPRQVFPMSAVRDAFRFMAQAKHVGKIVVRHTPAAGVFVPDASYLVTGGAGGLGLEVARWMVDHGARHLILVGRSGASAEAQRAIASLEQAGATVILARADVAVREQMEGVFAGIPRAFPLRGIVHAAGCLDDGVIRQLTRERLARVMAPKVQGAWHLHQLSRNAVLDFFVLFSSGAAVFGSPGQANYAAGNAFLDALSQYRRAQQLPGVSINWGAWSDVGMAARLESRERARLSASGIAPIDPLRGLDALREVIRRDRAQIVVLPIDWSAFARQFKSSAVPAFVEELASTAPAVTASPRAGAPTDDLLLRLATCEVMERRFIMDEHVRDQIARVLGLDPSYEIASDQGFTDLGMDSLMAVELSNRLRGVIGKPLPSTLAFEHPTVDALSAHLLEDVLKLTHRSSDSDEATRGITTENVDEFPGLSDEEIERTLTAELDRAGY